MRKDKEKAIKFRKKGESYRSIEKQLKIPRSTLTEWFKDLEWSQHIKEKLDRRARKSSSERMRMIVQKINNHRKRTYHRYRMSARKSFAKFYQDPLFMCGLMLYWGEGDSKLANGQMRIANSDPMIIRLFHIFLKKFFKELDHKKIKAWLVLYPDLDDYTCRKYWSEAIGIPYERFIKSQYIQGRSEKRILTHGVGNLYISSRAQKEVLLEWINCMRRKAKNMRV